MVSGCFLEDRQTTRDSFVEGFGVDLDAMRDALDVQTGEFACAARHAEIRATFPIAVISD